MNCYPIIQKVINNIKEIYFTNQKRKEVISYWEYRGGLRLGM
jgi:hypothetical protein